METINQVNNFQNSENETAQNYNGANIKNLINQYLPQQTKKIILKYKNNKLINSEELFLELLKLNHLNFEIKMIYNCVILSKELENPFYFCESKICLQLEKILLIKLKNNLLCLSEKNINEFIQFVCNFNSLFDFYYNLIKNHNVILLRLFFDLNPYNGVNWNYTNLKIWLKEQPSNLIIYGIKNIEEIFELGYNGHFEHEDAKEWSEIEEYYHHTRYLYQLKLKENEISTIEDLKGLDYFCDFNTISIEGIEKKYENILLELEMKIFYFEQDRKHYKYKIIEEESQLFKDYEDLIKNEENK